MYLGKSSWTFVAIIRYWHGLHSDSVAHRLHAVLWSRTCRMEQALVIVDCCLFTLSTLLDLLFPKDSFSSGSFLRTLHLSFFLRSLQAKPVRQSRARHNFSGRSEREAGGREL